MTENKIAGQVHFLDRMKQPIDFSNIKIGSIVPCDIDLLCEVRRKFCTEYKNKAWIFTEIKYRDTPFPFGQRLMHERLVDDLAKVGKPAISILAEHDVDNPSQNIDAAQCVVRQCYFDGVWKTPSKPRTLKDLINSFIAYINK